MQLAMGVLQFVMKMAGVGIVVSHLPALCTRISMGVSTAGSLVLRCALFLEDDPAGVRRVSFVVGDGAVAACVEAMPLTAAPVGVSRKAALATPLGAPASRRHQEKDWAEGPALFELLLGCRGHGGCGPAGTPALPGGWGASLRGLFVMFVYHCEHKSDATWRRVSPVPLPG